MSFHFSTPGTPGLGAYLGQALGAGTQNFAETLSQRLSPEAQEKAQTAALRNALMKDLFGEQEGGLPIEPETQGAPGTQPSVGEMLGGKTPQKPQRQPGEVTEKHLIAAAATKDPALTRAISTLYKGQQQEKSQEKKLNLAETKDIRKEIDTDFKDYHGLNLRLNRMEQLNEKGQLPAALSATAAEKLGLPAAIFNPDSEEFDKLSKDMLKNIKTFFPGRINVVEVQNFLKTIPSLKQSEEGRKRIIDNLRMLSEPTKLAYEAKRAIIKENGGVPPLDLFDQIQDRLSPQLDEITQRFNRNEGVSEGIEEKSETIFESLPSPQQYKGKKMRDKSSGKVYESMGTTWRLVG